MVWFQQRCRRFVMVISFKEFCEHMPFFLQTRFYLVLEATKLKSETGDEQTGSSNSRWLSSTSCVLAYGGQTGYRWSVYRAYGRERETYLWSL